MPTSQTTSETTIYAYGLRIRPNNYFRIRPNPVKPLTGYPICELTEESQILQQLLWHYTCCLRAWRSPSTSGSLCNSYAKSYAKPLLCVTPVLMLTHHIHTHTRTKELRGGGDVYTVENHGVPRYNMIDTSSVNHKTSRTLVTRHHRLPETLGAGTLCCIRCWKELLRTFEIIRTQQDCEHVV